MRYIGRIILEVEGEMEHPIAPAGDALRVALTKASASFPQVVSVDVKYDPKLVRFTVELELESHALVSGGETEELDEIAEGLVAKAFTDLESESGSEEIVVLESALIPA